MKKNSLIVFFIIFAMLVVSVYSLVGVEPGEAVGEGAGGVTPAIGSATGTSAGTVSACTLSKPLTIDYGSSNIGYDVVVKKNGKEVNVGERIKQLFEAIKEEDVTAAKEKAKTYSELFDKYKAKIQCFFGNDAKALLEAIAWVESGFNKSAIGTDQLSCGLMQVNARYQGDCKGQTVDEIKKAECTCWSKWDTPATNVSASVKILISNLTAAYKGCEAFGDRQIKGVMEGITVKEFLALVAYKYGAGGTRSRIKNCSETGGNIVIELSASADLTMFVETAAKKLAWKHHFEGKKPGEGFEGTTPTVKEEKCETENVLDCLARNDKKIVMQTIAK